MKIKSLFTGLFILLVSFGAMAQAVSDNAIIPIGVTLNPVLRINVVSGGNIQFVLNTIDDYKVGVSNDLGTLGEFHDTEFEVASSVDYRVYMTAESQLTGVDHGSSINLSYLGYHLSETGAYTVTSYLDLNPDDAVSSYHVLSETQFWIVQPEAAGYNSNAGDADDNDFWLQWEFATESIVASSAISGFATPLWWTSAFIRQNYVPDYYITNVLLELAPVNAW